MSEPPEPSRKETPATRRLPESGGAEQQRLESELRFQALVLGQVNDAVVVVDAGQHVTYFNQAAERLYGVTGDQALGGPLREVYEYRWARPEDEAEAYEALARSGFWRGENVHVRRDGAELHVESAVSALKDETGRVTGLLAVVRDVTARRRAEAALRESEDRYRDLVESSHELMCTHDLEGRILSVNRWAAEVLGYPRGSLVGMSIRDGLPPERRAEFDEYLRAVKRDGFAKGIMQVRTAAGEVRFWEYHNTLRVEGVEAPVVRGMAHDVTERRQALAREKEARKEAEAANRLKDEFLATVSHELRTPLASIIGWARMLAEEDLNAGEQAQALEIIWRNARAQVQLVDDLLDVSRIITGKLRLDVRPVNLASVIEAAVDSVRPAADAKGIDLRLVLEPRLNLIQGDPGRLQQVVWNLLSNAVKFTPERGRVEVRVERLDAHAAVVVSDTGRGIAPEFLPHVFERFRQADSSTTRLHGGLGLGLAIVRHLVEAHGGSVRADSEGEGRGATFTVELPLSVEAEPVRPPAPAGVAEGAPMTRQPAAGTKGGAQSLPLIGLRVLMVDDDADAVEMLAAFLRRAGAEVTAVASAPAALDALGPFRPDLIVADVAMPEVDGREMMRRVRSLGPDEGGRTPAVALTAYAGEAERSLSLRSGFQAHLDKPAEPGELLKVIAELARKGKTVD
jgi:PAS domain S-box-containing protein